MIKISLCMIVKNEEKVLSRCLDSVKDYVDEIIIVDTGSNDTTKEIAKRYTDLVYDFKWIDDFAAARNYSFSKAAMPFCMWMDADDVLLPKDQEALLKLKETSPDYVDVFMLPYHVAFDKQGKVTMSYYRERIVKKQTYEMWQGFVHEVISPFGNIVCDNAAITHKKPLDSASHSTRNLDIYKKQIEKGRVLDPREQFYYGRELFYNNHFDSAINILDKFLKEGNGWIENNIEACRTLSHCYNNISDSDSALTALFYSFQYDTPRAEVCCDIGLHFIKKQKYRLAIYWYKQALSVERKDSTGAFVLPDCYNFIPYIQLCVCYSKLGDQEIANDYNEKAGSIKPSDPSYLSNKQYFQSLSLKSSS